MEDKNNLYKLLCLPLYNDYYKERFDGNAIIQEVKRNPGPAAIKYKFCLDTGDCKPYVCYPLHMAVRLRANINVIKALYDSYPPAVKAKCENREVDFTALHLAAKYNASIEVISFFFDLWPEAIKKIDSFGFMPLHWSCINASDDKLEVTKFLLGKFPEAVRARVKHGYNFGKSALHLSLLYNAPAELTCLLLKYWPGAAREKDRIGSTPLHAAIHNENGTCENVSLILEHCPDAVKVIQGNFGRTPLHSACYARAPLNAFFLLLEKWPEATLIKDKHGMTPHEICPDSRVGIVLSHVSQLCCSKVDSGASKECMDFFISVGWWNGVPLILDNYPSFVKTLEMETKLLPTFWSIVGRCCRLKTMWTMICNELDIMEGV